MNDIPLGQVRIDGGTQPRAAIAEHVVSEYADALHAGSALPPFDLFFDGVDYWLADGFHRYHAAQRLGLETYPATIHNGIRREAVLFSAGANQAHGLRRSNDDKRKAVTTLLNDAEWSKWSNREIAERCGVSHQFVNDIRISLATVASEPSRTYTTKHGTIATMNVENIGATRTGVHNGRIMAERAAAQARRDAAIEGGSNAITKRLPRKHDAEIVANAVQTLRGLNSVFGLVDPAPLSADPRAEEWRSVVAETIGILRSFNKRLERKAV